LRKRKETNSIQAGKLIIGGSAPVSIQSMTNLPIENVKKTIKQVNELKDEGADLVRLAVKNIDMIQHLKVIIKETDIPLSADIHFNYKIAIESIKAGIDKIRLNPGNIKDSSKIKEVIKAAKDYSVPIRIGVNEGSIDRKKYSIASPENLVKSAIDHIRILEDNNFTDIAVSIKSSDIFHTIEANILFSEKQNYPIHIGLTEAGFGLSCTVQSSVAIGHLLMLGIGDTIRVSMTGDPIQEIKVGKKILESTGDLYQPIKIISCPTCGRKSEAIDILKLAQDAESESINKFGEQLKAREKKITIAVMGCEVNGPGEAGEADIGIAAGKKDLLLFSKGEKIKKVTPENAIEEILFQIKKILRD
jgi:(E)-4-hydroxy-3-methylbut-2-enyl-diphosphate synthase